MKILSNQNGNISMAMMQVVFTLLASSSMAFIAYSDTLTTVNDCNMMQVFNFLRSEAGRGETILENYDALHEGFYLPEKIATIITSNSKSTYSMQSRLMNGDISQYGNINGLNKFYILSLVYLKNSSEFTTPVSMLNTSVKGFSEKAVRRGNSILNYQYFTDTDRTTNDTNNYFWGPDVMYGKVHSNTDIWIKQGGGGNNNGWPTFYGTVYTAGQIQSFSSSPPYSNVFRNGYFEHVNQLDFNPTADLIRAHGTAIGSTAYDPNRIMFVEVNGGSYSSWIGQVINAGPDTADVWTQYPPRGGTYLFRNRWTKYDTLWTAGPCGVSSGHSNISYSKLWLRGRFQGAQTWCSVDTLYLNDDCYLAGTMLGSCPDGSVSGSSLNRTDILGLVSEKSIIIQYGYRDPQDSTRYKPNCGNDSYGGIWIYAALCALGDGQGNSHRDGVFSFEYQHPHPSVPAVRLPGSSYVWRNIDLHRRKYPQTPSSPWPGNIDYPWYNPLWPEASPTLERGYIHLYGSVYQRRSGYVHRELSDPEYPNPGQIWSVPIDFCGGPAGNSYYDTVLDMTFSCENAPGATGSGVGYKRDFHYDNRFNYMTPPDFPEVHVAGNGDTYEMQSWHFKKPPRSLTVLD